MSEDRKHERHADNDRRSFGVVVDEERRRGERRRPAVIQQRRTLTEEEIAVLSMPGPITFVPNVTASDAVTMFAAWLSTHDVAVSAGLDDCAWWAQKALQFLDANDLGGVSAAYPDNLKHPD